MTQSVVDVGILIVNQNQGTLLERCIRSCLAQTFPGRFHEVLVVDAGSTDFSRELIQGYGSRIVPVLVDSAVEIERAVGLGLRRATGRYILPVRAQDFISDYTILFQAIWLYQNPEYHGVGVDYFLVEGDSDTKLRRISGAERPSPYGTMVRKEVFVKEGLYGAEEGRWVPEVFQKRLSTAYRVGHIPIPFYRYLGE